MADFKAISEYETIPATIASATVVEAGDLVELDTGIVIKATATAAAVAFAPQGSVDGETEIEISKGYVELVGTGDAVFANSYKGTEVDLSGSTNLKIDVTGGTTYKVLLIASSTDAGTVDSADDIKVFINKPITF